MSIALENKVRQLAEKLNEQDQRIEGLVQQINELKAAPVVVAQQLVDREAKPAKKLCPKCNEAPGYFFHVRSCSGPKLKQETADDRIRTSKPD